MHPAGAPATDQSRALENAEVLGNGGEGHGVGPSQASDGLVAAGQVLQNPASGRIGQSREGAIEGGAAMFNHVVK